MINIIPDHSEQVKNRILVKKFAALHPLIDRKVGFDVESTTGRKAAFDAVPAGLDSWKHVSISGLQN